MTDHCVVWLYAVAADPVEPAELSGILGVSGAPVRTISASDLAAVISDVPIAEFSESALRANLEDLGWLEATATAHHRVIDRLAQDQPLVPMRLATIYSADGSVRAMLDERARDIRTVLERTAACQEWGVKVYAAGPPAAASPAGSRSSASAAPVSGADYLRRRKDELAARADSQRDAHVSAEQIYTVLAHHAVASRLHPPQSPKLSGATAAMLLNAAYLVRHASNDEFATAVQQTAAQYPGMQLQLTGPWPPYSFATLEQELGSPAVAGR
jgi:Gas vesicle synthesis protein GvpL/GvpF